MGGAERVFTLRLSFERALSRLFEYAELRRFERKMSIVANQPSFLFTKLLRRIFQLSISCILNDSPAGELYLLWMVWSGPAFPVQRSAAEILNRLL